MQSLLKHLKTLGEMIITLAVSYASPKNIKAK